MGRYYYEESHDSFDGKFWFCTQSSDALTDILGILPDEPSLIGYSIHESDIKNLQKFMDETRAKIKNMPTDNEILDSDYEALYTFADTIGKKQDRTSLANYELALKCSISLQKHDYIYVSCEL